MPNLRVIACIGQESWYLSSVLLGERAAARRASEFRDRERVLVGAVGVRTVAASAHFHPSRGSRGQWALGWAGLASLIATSPSADSR